MDQLSLFDYIPDPPPKPRRTVSADRVSYTRISGGRWIACDDCMALYTEMERPPMARRARFKRTTTQGTLLLCGEHATFHHNAEAKERNNASRVKASRKKDRYMT
jgi:hypothetical protein